jgi:hypothetical protein
MHPMSLTNGMVIASHLGKKGLEKNHNISDHDVVTGTKFASPS